MMRAIEKFLSNEFECHHHCLNCTRRLLALISQKKICKLDFMCLLMNHAYFIWITRNIVDGLRIFLARDVWFFEKKKNLTKFKLIKFIITRRTKFSKKYHKCFKNFKQILAIFTIFIYVSTYSNFEWYILVNKSWSFFVHTFSQTYHLITISSIIR